jgi:hypothetical protein
MEPTDNIVFIAKNSLTEIAVSLFQSDDKDRLKMDFVLLMDGKYV